MTESTTLTPRRSQSRRNISNINDQLEQIEEAEALLMSEWLLKKSQYFKQHHKRSGYGSLPRNITKGDIVRVDWGINLGDEYSDKGQDGHFSLVWAQKGFLFVVIPLTKVPQTNNDFSVNLGKIEGLPEDVDTWAKLESIRSVSIRRIKRMNEQAEGKLSIKDKAELMELIKNKFTEKFL